MRNMILAAAVAAVMIGFSAQVSAGETYPTLGMDYSKEYRSAAYPVRNVDLSEFLLSVTTTEGSEFRYNVKDVVVEINPQLKGTYVATRSRNYWSGDTIKPKRELYAFGLVLFVRNAEQKKTWDGFLKNVQRQYYAPRDVLPPDIGQNNSSSS